jgi:hypothetical protein
MKVVHYRFAAFQQTFGREPGPDEPLFFDPACALPRLAQPKEIRRQLMAAAAATGVEPALLSNLMP